MTDGSPDDLPDLTDTEAEAVHEIELGIEWLHRAYGELVELHHKTGHGFDHFDEAVSLLREAGRDDLADTLEQEHLSSGIVDGRWTYDLLEAFDEGLYDDLTDFEHRAREQITDGKRHVVERRQHRRWQRRGDDE